MPVEVARSGAALGAEIRSVDLSRPLDDATFAQIHRAFLDNEIIFFRGQALSDEDHIRFSRRFGELRRVNLDDVDKRYPEIFIVSNIMENGQYIGSYDAGIFWHTDGSYLPNPHAASFLRAIEIPMQDGRALGDTVYASMTAAYDALDEPTRRRIDGLKAVHSIKYREEQTNKAGITKKFNQAMMAAPEAVHPLARLHPVTGRKCLWVSQGYTVRILGLPEDESQALIRQLSHYCVEERFQYRHRWQLHDLVLWDNCSTQHKATFDYALPQRRLLHRTVVMNPASAGTAESGTATHASM